jgi:hypothetical protein
MDPWWPLLTCTVSCSAQVCQVGDSWPLRFLQCSSANSEASPAIGQHSQAYQSCVGSPSRPGQQWITTQRVGRVSSTRPSSTWLMEQPPSMGGEDSETCILVEERWPHACMSSGHHPAWWAKITSKCLGTS